MTASGEGVEQSAAAFMRETLARTEKFDAAELLHFQTNHLKHFLSFAHLKVPFYKERLAPLFRKDGSVDLAHWHDIPVLTRAEVQKNGEDMLPQELPTGHGQVHS